MAEEGQQAGASRTDVCMSHYDDPGVVKSGAGCGCETPSKCTINYVTQIT